MTAWTLHGDILCEDGEPVMRLKPSGPSGWDALRAQSAARKITAAPDLLRELKSARLMLYAWKGTRKDAGLGEHPELNDAIASAEAAIAKAECRT